MLCSCTNASDSSSFVPGEIDSVHVTVLRFDGLAVDRCYFKLRCSFSDQNFKSKTVVPTVAGDGHVNERFDFFTSKLDGEEIVFEVTEHKRLFADKLVGLCFLKLDKGLLDVERSVVLKLSDSQRDVSSRPVEVHVKVLATGSLPKAAPPGASRPAPASVAASASPRNVESASAAAVPASSSAAADSAAVDEPAAVAVGGSDDAMLVSSVSTSSSGGSRPPTTLVPLNKSASLPPIARRATDRLEDVYVQERELGRGGMSTVYLGESKLQPGFKVAIKVISKKLIRDPKELQLLQREIDIMRKLHHPNLLELYDVFETPDALSLVMELASGGELFDAIIQRGGFYPEAEAAPLIAQVLEAINYCHSLGIAHRDLKPENLLLVEKSRAHDHGEALKIADFGLAKDFAFEAMETQCGTPDYVAPEVILEDSYSQACDVWSIGVITYVLLCGSPPFYSEYQPPRQRDLFDKITKAQYEFFSPEWDAISTDAKDFIRKVLVVDPAQRYTAEQCLQHPWITKHRQAPSENNRHSSRTFDYTKFKTYAGKYNKKYDKS